MGHGHLVPCPAKHRPHGEGGVQVAYVLSGVKLARSGKSHPMHVAESSPSRALIGRHAAFCQDRTTLADQHGPSRDGCAKGITRRAIP